MKYKEIMLNELTLEKVKEIEGEIKQDPNKEKPVFCSKGLTVGSRVKDMAKNNYKVLLRCENGDGYDGVFWNAPTTKRPVWGMKVDILYTPTVNRWRGIETIQLNIKGLEIVEESVERVNV